MNSSFGSSYFSREDTKQYFEEAFALAEESHADLMLEGGAYALPYASVVTDVPVQSNHYSIEDEDVPFYQLVVSRFASCVSQPINLTSNPRLQFLRCIQSSSVPQFTFVAGDPTVLQETELAELFAVDFDKVAKRGDDAIYNTFNNGDAAMLYGPSYMTKGDYFPTIFAKQNVGLAPVPKYDNSKTYNVPGSCYGFWVSKGGFKRNGKFDVDLLNAFLNAAVVEEEERGKKGSEINNMLRDESVKKWSPKNRKFTNEWYDEYADIQRSFSDATVPFVEPYDDCINISQVLDVMTGWGDQPPGTFGSAVNMFEGELQKQLDDLGEYAPD